jgi:hypothetical protein
MTVMNIVHMRVKPGKDREFLAIQSQGSDAGFSGMRRFSVVKTGERDYCVVGEWDSMQALAGARPKMIGLLDKTRSLLEDLGGGRGVTEPWSGEVALELKA